MINSFINAFIEKKEGNKREKAGLLSSITGVFANLLLFALKFFTGKISGSISVVTDSFNNLSDCLSNIVTMIGFRLSAKAPDKEHPFGHGRIEYLCSLFVSVLIIYVGIDFLRSCIKRLLSPVEVSFNAVTALILALTIIVKIWMYLLNRTLSQRYQSDVLAAISKDSLSDSIITSVTLLGLFAGQFTDLALDAIIGIMVSLMILKAGIGIARDTIDSLIGKPAEEKDTDAIRSIVLADPDILGIHDLAIHSYGPDRIMAVMDCEVDSRMSLLKAHQIADRLEKQILETTGISATIHIDPLQISEEEYQKYHDMMLKIIADYDRDISMHDFQIHHEGDSIVLSFDLAVSSRQIRNTSQITEALTAKAAKLIDNVTLDITYDNRI